MAKYTINNEPFSSKAEIRKRMNDMEKRYSDYVPVTGKDFDFIMDLLKYHPNHPKKVDGMTDIFFGSICVDTITTRCLFITYGKKEDPIEKRPVDDVSWTICLHNIPVPTEHKVHLKFQFGKHKGKTIEEVYEADKPYLNWIISKEFKDRGLKIKVNQFLKYGYIPYNPVARMKAIQRAKIITD